MRTMRLEFIVCFIHSEFIRLSTTCLPLPPLRLSSVYANTYKTCCDASQSLCESSDGAPNKLTIIIQIRWWTKSKLQLVREYFMHFYLELESRHFATKIYNAIKCLVSF